MSRSVRIASPRGNDSRAAGVSIKGQPVRRKRKARGKGREQSLAGRQSSLEAAAVSRSWFSAHRRLLAALGLLLLSLALYAPTMSHPFTSLDDREYVTGNTHVLSGLTWSTIRWSLTSSVMGHWHPLTWMSHALDVDLFGQTATGHHFTSVALHAISAVLLFYFLAGASGATFRSLLVAALFAIHPTNVESVAWIAERKSALSTMWFLAALCAYVWYSRQPNWKRYLAVAGFFLLGLTSKAMLVTLPFVLLLLDYWPLERIPQGAWPSRRLILEKVPLLVFSAVASALAYWAQRAAGALALFERLSFKLRAQNALYSYALYVWKISWPARLTILYPFPKDMLNWRVAAEAALFLTIVTVVVVRSRRRYLWTGWLWFLGTLVPVIGIIQAGPQGMADRYLYIPAIGIFWMLVWGVAEVADLVAASFAVRIVAALVVLIALSAATVKQLSYWSSNERLWQHALDVTKNNYVAEDKYANELLTQKRFDEAYPHFENALRINPSDPLANFDIGARLHLAGQLGPAIAHYEITVGQDTDPILRSQGYENMGTAYRQLGDYSSAAENYRKAIFYNPQKTSLYRALQEAEASKPAHK
jgi:protein O-mannosyl-transferase